MNSPTKAPPPPAEAQARCPSCDGYGWNIESVDSFTQVSCPDCAGSGQAEHSITVNEAQAQGGGEVIQRHVVTKYRDGSVHVADVAAPPSAPVGVDGLPLRYFAYDADNGDYNEYNTLAEAVASAHESLDYAGDDGWPDGGPSICYGAVLGEAHEVEGSRRPRGPDDHPDFDFVVEYELTEVAALTQQPAADEEAAEQFRKGWQAGYAAAQQPAACPKCGGTGEADSGGVMPWGAPAMILCECQQPAAVDEACAWSIDTVDESWDGACGAKWQFTNGGPDDNDMRHCPQCGKRIATQHQEPTT